MRLQEVTRTTGRVIRIAYGATGPRLTALSTRPGLLARRLAAADAPGIARAGIGLIVAVVVASTAGEYGEER